LHHLNHLNALDVVVVVSGFVLNQATFKALPGDYQRGKGSYPAASRCFQEATCCFHDATLLDMRYLDE
jgi:hypothetical protein